MSFNNMGKPIPDSRRDAAYSWLRSIGVEREAAWGGVQSMSDCLERDHPHEAMQAGRRIVDETGVYRLMAVLLTSTPNRESAGAPKERT